MQKQRNVRPVRLTEDLSKIIGAISYVIYIFSQKGREPTQYDIVKSLFLADRAHLNNWGRPITFDNYFAMKHGPVPSLSYDLLKANTRLLKDYAVDNLPWERRAGPSGKHFFRPADTSIDFEDTLSESEMDALRLCAKAVLDLGFAQVRRLTHDDAAYLDAWDDESEESAFPMDLALMFDEPDRDAAASLAEYSPYRA